MNIHFTEKVHEVSVHNVTAFHYHDMVNFCLKGR